MGGVKDEPERNSAVGITGHGKADRIARAFFRQPRAEVRVSKIAGFKVLVSERVQLMSGRLA